MKRRRWVCSKARASLALAALVAALAWCVATPAHAWATASATAPAIEPARAEVLVGTDAALPADLDPRWQTVALPDARAATTAWYRVAVDLPPEAASGAGAWMLYLPYLYGGGRVWLNGELVATIPENSATLRVRWERPHLLALPPSLQRAGRNVLHLRVTTAHSPSGTMLPRLAVGPQIALQPQFDRRLFFVRTAPVITVVVAFVAGLFALYIWLRRPAEHLYAIAGLIGVACALRTTTFVFDTIAADWWPAWRLLYHASNGGFIVLLAMFALRAARWHRPALMWGLGLYAALGPLLYGLGGDTAEPWVGRWWVAGLIPIGLLAVVVAVLAAWRKPSMARTLIALAFVITLLTGVHDYLVAWRSPWIVALLPQWSAHRFFLLHYGANLLLLTLGVLTTLRYVRNLRALEESHRTLEARVARRELEIATSYERIAALQRHQAATDERQRIMADLHDGLGAQLFTSLLQSERGALAPRQMSDMLRAAIDEMRVAIEALASSDGDLQTALVDFRYRWDARLRDAGLRPHWQAKLPDAVQGLPPHAVLQVLRIAQEALTNVLKHARAREVWVRIGLQDDALVLEVADDGVGLHPAAGQAGRGMANMLARAERLGGRLEQPPSTQGTRIVLHLPIPRTRDAVTP